MILRKNNQAFTLLEILLVVAAIAILATVIVLAINPTKQLGDTRNAKRNIDKDSIYKAVTQYEIDHNTLPGPGVIPDGTEADAEEICQTGITEEEAENTCIVLSDLVVNNRYLSSIPIDPLIDITDEEILGSGYALYKNSINHRIYVVALNTETPSIGNNDEEENITTLFTGNGLNDLIFFRFLSGNPEDYSLTVDGNDLTFLRYRLGNDSPNPQIGDEVVDSITGSTGIIIGFSFLYDNTAIIQSPTYPGYSNGGNLTFVGSGAYAVSSGQSFSAMDTVTLFDGLNNYRYIPMQAAGVILNKIEFVFAAQTGHVLGDKWEFTE